MTATIGIEPVDLDAATFRRLQLLALPAVVRFRRGVQAL